MKYQAVFSLKSNYKIEIKVSSAALLIGALRDKQWWPFSNTITQSAEGMNKLDSLLSLTLR